MQKQSAAYCCGEKRIYFLPIHWHIMHHLTAETKQVAVLRLQRRFVEKKKHTIIPH